VGIREREDRNVGNGIRSLEGVSMSSDTPALGGILETALYVRDMARSREFYAGVFGFQAVGIGERLSAMAIRPGQILLLCLQRASSGLGSTAHDGEGQLHLAFSIPATELDAWERRLTDRRIEIVERRSWDRGGTSLFFRDPDGHLLELATPGVWANY
jgi:catechol 2,3-dioxygenase-like lactoylglutathione lyase family enzyme